YHLSLHDALPIFEKAGKGRKEWRSPLKKGYGIKRTVTPNWKGLSGTDLRTSSHVLRLTILLPSPSCPLTSRTKKPRLAAGSKSMRVHSLEFLLLQLVLEQLEDAPVFIQPGLGMHEAVRVQRIGRDLKVFLLQLDEPPHQPHGILEEHVVVLHSVGDEHRHVAVVVRVLDRRALLVRHRVDQ